MDASALLRQAPFQGGPGWHRRCSNKKYRAFSSKLRATNQQAPVTALPLPDGNLGLPLIGETLQLLNQGDTFGEQRSAQYGEMWKTNILGSPTIMVFGEEDCRRLLKEEGNLVEVIWPDVTAELVGGASLNLLKGEEHLRLKRTLGDAFSEEAVEALAPVLQECTQLFCKRWTQMGSFSAYDECKLWAWSVFGCAVLGLPASPEAGERLCSLMDTLQAGFQTAPVKLPLTPYQKAVNAREAIAQIIRQQMTEISRGKGASKCCLASMMAEGRLTEAQIIDNVIAAAFGNASAGPTAAKAFQHLAAGNARDRVTQELAGHDGLALHDLQQLEVTNAVIRELLRITPIVPALFRRALKDFELSGRLIPKGWSVYIHTGSSVQLYNRDSFHPERWLGRSGERSSPVKRSSAGSTGIVKEGRGASGADNETYMEQSSSAGTACPEHSLPFGLGPRMCLGRFIVKAALIHLVAELVSRHEWRMADPAEQWSVFPTVRPKQGLHVRDFSRLQC